MSLKYQNNKKKEISITQNIQKKKKTKSKTKREMKPSKKKYTKKKKKKGKTLINLGRRKLKEIIHIKIIGKRKNLFN